MTGQDNDMLVFQTSAESRYNALSKEILKEIENAMNDCTRKDRLEIALKICELPLPDDDLEKEEPEKSPMQSLAEAILDALTSWQSVREFSKNVKRRETDI